MVKTGVLPLNNSAEPHAGMGARGGSRSAGRGRSALTFLVLALAPCCALYDCPDDKLQGAYRVSTSRKDKHYGCCSQICLSPGLRSVATKHGVRYGSTCSEQGCTEFLGEDTNAGQHFYLFSCPEEVIRAHQPSPQPPPAPSPPGPPPSPPALRAPPLAPPPSGLDSPRPRAPYAVKYTDMACGALLATRVPNLDECALLARRHGDRYFSYNMWWKFCLACSPAELAVCEQPAVASPACHYQVGFAIYQQELGGPAADLGLVWGPGGDAGEPSSLGAEPEPGGRAWHRETLAVVALALAPAVSGAYALRRSKRRHTSARDLL